MDISDNWAINYWGFIVMTERVFINSDNIATFMCPDCKKVRHADVSNIIGIDKTVKIKCQCKCGNKFDAILERRKFFRKSIDFDGICYTGKEDEKFKVTVVDISRSGLKLRLNASHNLSRGDELLIEFHLDDAEQTLVNKKVVVRSISGLNVGVEFKSPEHYDKLGSYLMFY